MKESRIEYFKNFTLEELSNLTYEDFTISEIKEIIEETPLSPTDKKIATYRFVNRLNADEIANKIYLDKRTIYVRIEKISQKLKNTCKKMLK